jgi:hypothetical protein
MNLASVEHPDNPRSPRAACHRGLRRVHPVVRPPLDPMPFADYHAGGAPRAADAGIGRPKCVGSTRLPRDGTNGRNSQDGLRWARRLDQSSLGTVAESNRRWPAIARRDRRAFPDERVRVGRNGTTGLEATIRHPRCSLHRVLIQPRQAGRRGPWPCRHARPVTPGTPPEASQAIKLRPSGRSNTRISCEDRAAG